MVPPPLSLPSPSLSHSLSSTAGPRIRSLIARRAVPDSLPPPPEPLHLVQDPRRRPSVDTLLARPSILRRREELSSVLDGTLKAAIADDELDMLATIQVGNLWLEGCLRIAPPPPLHPHPHRRIRNTNSLPSPAPPRPLCCKCPLAVVVRGRRSQKKSGTLPKSPTSCQHLATPIVGRSLQCRGQSLTPVGCG
jgi:hypothetical protein